MDSLNIPNSWAPTQIGETCLLNVKEKLEDDFDIGFMPMAGLPTTYFGKCDFENRKWEKVKKGFTQFKDGDTIFAKITPCFENSKASVIEGFPNGWGAGSTEYYVLRPIAQLFDPKLLFGIVKSKDFLDNGAANMSGSVGHRRVPKYFVSNYPIGLPPLAEQKEIANQLDSLLAKVDSIKSRLDAIPDIIKRFRQSILVSAVSGKLTEEWREGNQHISAPHISLISDYWDEKFKQAGKKRSKVKFTEADVLVELPESWVSTGVGNIFDVYVGSTPKRNIDEYWHGTIPWVSSSEVAFCRITSTKESITPEGLSTTSTNVHPVGTVMLAMIGQGKTRGQVAILDIEACHNQNTSALRIPEDFVLSEFLYFFLTKQYEETRSVGGGNNQKALNKSFVQSLAFPLPPIEEQKEIVNYVENFFSFSDKVEQKVNAAQERVNNLTQAILAKAFRGELTSEWRELNQALITGENSAEALLAKIKTEREALTKKQSTKKKPVKKKTTTRKVQD